MPILSKHVFFLNLIFGVRVILAYWEGGYLNSLLLVVELKVMGFLWGVFLAGMGGGVTVLFYLRNVWLYFRTQKKYGSLLKIKAIM